MQRIPGVNRANGPSGWRARVAGTGIDVFEVIRTFQNCGQDLVLLQETYHWLNESQLRAALAYAEANPAEITLRLAAEDRWDAAKVARQFPFTQPK